MEKRFLEEREKFLKEVLNDLKTKLEELTFQKFEPGDEADICAQEKENSNVLKFKRRTSNYMTKVQNSLGKVKSGTYGVCEDCACDIELGRLKARPTATMCISCKEEEEHIQRLTAKVVPIRRNSQSLDKVAR